MLLGHPGSACSCLLSCHDPSWHRLAAGRHVTKTDTVCCSPAYLGCLYQRQQVHVQGAAHVHKPACSGAQARQWMRNVGNSHDSLRPAAQMNSALCLPANICCAWRRCSTSKCCCEVYEHLSPGRWRRGRRRPDKQYRYALQAVHIPPATPQLPTVLVLDCLCALALGDLVQGVHLLGGSPDLDLTTRVGLACRW
jgi:hypothetical protein